MAMRCSSFAEISKLFQIYSSSGRTDQVAVEQLSLLLVAVEELVDAFVVFSSFLGGFSDLVAGLLALELLHDLLL
jgi:hypothetical protein